MINNNSHFTYTITINLGAIRTLIKSEKGKMMVKLIEKEHNKLDNK